MIDSIKFRNGGKASYFHFCVYFFLIQENANIHTSHIIVALEWTE